MSFIWIGLMAWHGLCALALFLLARRLPANRPVAHLVAGLLMWTNVGYALAYLVALALATRG